MSKNEHSAYTDHGTILQPNETALVVNEDGNMWMYTRGDIEESEEVSRLEMFLAAVFMKCSDEEWMEEIIQETFYDGVGHC